MTVLESNNIPDSVTLLCQCYLVSNLLVFGISKVSNKTKVQFGYNQCTGLFTNKLQGKSLQYLQGLNFLLEVYNSMCTFTQILQINYMQLELSLSIFQILEGGHTFQSCNHSLSITHLHSFKMLITISLVELLTYTSTCILLYLQKQLLFLQIYTLH